MENNNNNRANAFESIKKGEKNHKWRTTKLEEQSQTRATKESGQPENLFSVTKLLTS